MKNNHFQQEGDTCPTNDKIREVTWDGLAMSYADIYIHWFLGVNIMMIEKWMKWIVHIEWH